MLGAATSSSPAATLTWALAERPATLDPLYARSAADRLVARQVHEPLVEDLGGPFGVVRRLPGLALSVLPSADSTVWRVELRPGVRFQDGTPFDAAAVLANADRWLSTAAGREALGEVLVDVPRPDLIRFTLPTPDPSFDRRLASPRLAIVSPRAIAEAAGGPLDPTRLPETGTGPFELREHSADRLLLARNTGWWGSERGLGPGVDQLELRVIADRRGRLAELRDGAVRVAELGRAALAAVRANPLLTVVRQGAREAVGIERSVRGIPPGEPAPSLNAVWLTGIDPG